MRLTYPFKDEIDSRYTDKGGDGNRVENHFRRWLSEIELRRKKL